MAGGDRLTIVYALDHLYTRTVRGSHNLIALADQCRVAF